MARRRTKSEKIKTKTRSGFSVNFGSIKTKYKVPVKKADMSEVSYLKKDLTKVVAVSMLAVGSELALWWFLFK
jgi:hypothetical protein